MTQVLAAEGGYQAFTLSGSEWGWLIFAAVVAVVALLLGVTDVLKRSPPPPSLGVDLLFTDGEDYGEFVEPYTDVLIGARYYAAHQPPGPKPLYGVLFDLIADKDLQIYQEGNSVTGAPEVVNIVWETARDLGYGKVFVDTPKHILTDVHLELQ